MRNQGELIALYVAPGTRIAFPQFKKVDWAVILGSPHGTLYLPYVLIDLHKRSRSQQWIEHIVRETDVSVEGMANIKMLNE